MADASRHDRDEARPGDPRHAVDGNFKFALDHFVDFLLRMEMLVNGRAARELVMGECHVRRVEIASSPAGQALNDTEARGIDKRHGDQFLAAS